MSRMASMKKAASKEKSEINDDTAYNGTMTMIRTTILRFQTMRLAVYDEGEAYRWRRGFL